MASPCWLQRVRECELSGAAAMKCFLLAWLGIIVGILMSWWLAYLFAKAEKRVRQITRPRLVRSHDLRPPDDAS